MNMQNLDSRSVNLDIRVQRRNRLVNNIRTLILIILIGSLASCTLPTRYERDPAKAGFGRDDVKKSRCACMKFYENGKWL